MKTAIDAAGRIVIPKTLRDAMGLVPGQDLDIVERGGQLEIAPVPTPMRLVDDGNGPAAVADIDMPPLTVEMVREVLEQTRR